jgi:tetratricopeptide (TPR) repeat protein
MATQVKTHPETEKLDAAAAPPQSLVDALGDYRIVRKIHEDASCEVYKAEERRSKETVVIRFAYHEVFGHVGDPSECMKRAEKLLAIRHPRLASLLKVDATADGHWIFVSEFVHGVSLLDHANGLKISKKARLKLFVEVCKSVHGLHQRGVVHRDLRPSKIIVDGKAIPRIIDIGVAPLTEFDRHFRASAAASQGLGHLWSQKSPEQESGRFELVDIRTDIYTLGVILDELLAAKATSKSDSTEASGHLDSQSVTGIGKPEEAGPAVRGEIGDIIRKAMAPEPRDRYASALAMAEDIGNFLHKRPVQACAGGELYALGKFLRRRRIVVGTVGLAVALTFAFGISRHGLAMRNAELRLSEVKTGLSVELSRFDAAAQEARDMEGRAQAGLKGALAERDRLSSELSDARRDLAAGSQEHAALVAKIEQIELRPDPSADIAGFLVDVLANEDGDSLEAADVLNVRLLRRARETGEKRFADRPELRLALFGRLLDAFREFGQTGETERLLKGVIEMRRERLGATHRETVEATNELAMLLYGENRFAEAESLCRGLYELSRGAVDKADARTATTISNLAMTLKAQGRFEEAAELFRQALEMRVQQLGRSDLKTASAMFELGTVLFELGKITESEALLRESLAVFETHLPGSHWMPAQVGSRLAGALVAMGRFDEAHTRLLASYDRLEASLGAENAHTRSVAGQLVKLYKAWGRDKEAAVWVDRASPPKGG